MVESAVEQVQNWVAIGLLSFVAACASLEPQSSVWILASFGSAFSAFRGSPHGFFAGLGRWVSGTFFSVAFVRGIDHFNPEAEAVFIGFISAEMTKIFFENGGKWIGGALSSKLSGGGNAS